MKSKLLAPILAAVLFAAPSLTAQEGDGVSSATAAATKVLPVKIKQTKARIESLFRNRNTKAPVYDTRLNPFRLPGEAPPVYTSPGGGTPNAPAGNDQRSTDSELLQDAIRASLRIARGFTKDLGGVYYVTINQKLYKEGDMIVAEKNLSGAPIFLRVGKITETNLTLSLNLAEQKVDISR